MRRAFSILFLACPLVAATVTGRVDNSRISSTSTETILTPANVAAVVKLASCSVDGAVYGQPLYVPGVTISGTTYNLLIVATMNDSLYAFNAEDCSVVWSRIAFDAAWSSGFADNVPLFYGGTVGCLATPAVDSTAGYIYAVCANNTPNWIIRKFSLATGTTSATTTLAPSVTGTGDPNGGVADRVTGGVLSFFPKYSACRPALTLANSNVYVACGSYDDVDPWHGWLISYDTATLTQQAVFCSTPNGGGGSFWNAGGGLAVDGSGNLYGVTSNGDWNGTANFSMSAVKLSPSLALLDWFTPSNWAALSSVDIDLGSGQPMLIPGTSLLVWGAKDFKAYSVDTTCMGHLGGTVGGCTAPQAFLTNPNPGANMQAGIYMNSYMNGIGYFTNTNVTQSDVITAASVYACTLTASTWNTTCTASSSTWLYPGAASAGSSNAGSNAILWMVTPNGNGHLATTTGVLRAVNPANFTEYWNSGTFTGNVVKFTPPVIADGKVFVATLNSVLIYGIPAPVKFRGGLNARGAVNSR